MTTQLDINGYINYAEKKGRAEGAEQTRIETARRFLAMGLPIETVAQGTGLSSEDILKLKKARH